MTVKLFSSVPRTLAQQKALQKIKQRHSLHNRNTEITSETGIDPDYTKHIARSYLK